jgi:hypothetical protein
MMEKDKSDFSEKKNLPELKLQPVRGGGGSIKPPPPTALATGGPNDREKSPPIPRDRAPQTSARRNTVDFVSTPMTPIFVKVAQSGALLPGQVSHVKLMAQALTNLCGQKTSIAFYIDGDTDDASLYFGIVNPHPDASLSEAERLSQTRECVQKFLQSVYTNVELCEEMLTANSLAAHMCEKISFAGTITGTPSLCLPRSNNPALAQVCRVIEGMAGRKYGVLILAEPYVASSDKKTDQNDSWQVGAYFFTKIEKELFELQSLIGAYHIDQNCKPLLRLRPADNLKGHISQFGLLRNHKNSLDENSPYQYLTILDSKSLSAYIHLPVRELVQH